MYGRVGTCQQEFGTVASWLIDVLNVVTGNLDRPGGAMFTKAAVGAANTRGTPGRGKGLQVGRRKSRVGGLPEVLGEFPVGALADEIETPGEGQIRAMITIAGNPVLSNPNGARLDRADTSAHSLAVGWIHGSFTLVLQHIWQLELVDEQDDDLLRVIATYEF